MIERPRWNLTLFKVHFGLLTLKGYTKGEHVLRFEAIVHNTRRCAAAGCWTSSRHRRPGWPAWSTGSPACSTASTSASCPTASSTSSRPPRRSGPPGSAASTSTSPASATRWPRYSPWPSHPDGFTVADLAAKVRALTGQDDSDYTIRQAAYDLRKLRGKHLVVKPGRTRRYQVPGPGRPHHRRPTHPARPRHRTHPRRRPQTRTRPTTHDTGPASTVTTSTLRIDMRTLFHDLAIDAAA